MLRIEEIVGNVDDDFRDHLLEMDDERLRALLADAKTLRHLLPLGVSYREAVTVINAILEYRAQPPDEAPAPPPPAAKKPRSPRKKKAEPIAERQEPEPEPELKPEPIPPPPPQAEERIVMEPPPPPAPPPAPVRLPLSEAEGRSEEELPPPAPEPPPPALPPLRPRWRDHVILVLPILLAAVLVILLLKR